MWLAMAACVALRQDAPPILPVEAARRLEAAAVALRRDRPAEAANLLRDFVAAADPRQAAAGAEILKRGGVELPPLEALVDCRVRATLAGQHQAMGQALPAEARGAIAALGHLAERMLAPARAELKVGFQANIPHAAIDEDLRRLPDLLEAVQAADAALAAIGELAKLLPAREKKKAAPDDPLRRDVAAERKALPALQQQLAERLAALCAKRIPDMLEVIRRERANFNERLQAVARLEESFALLRAFEFRAKQARRTAGKKLDPDDAPLNPLDAAELKTALNKRPAQEKEFAAAAGALRPLAYRFEQGKQWWLRGRFGKGLLNGGLAKALPTGLQLRSVDSLASPLVMPQPILPPEDPLTRPNAEPPGRRAFAIHQLGSNRKPLPWDPASRSALSRRQWQTAHAPAEFRDPPVALVKWLDWQEPAVHAVGYLEYQMALYHWGKLLELAKPAEWQGLDEALADDDRFVVHTYLSRRYNDTPVAKASTLSLEPKKTTHPRAKDVYERRGLAWAIALARLDLGAMRALHTANEHELSPAEFDDDAMRNLPQGAVDSALAFEGRTSGGVRIVAPALPRPFQKWPPPPAVDRQPFAELLWDAARHQYLMLASARKVRSNAAADLNADSWEFAQLLAVALEATRGYRTLFAGDLVVNQRSELESWEKDLAAELDALMRRRSARAGAEIARAQAAAGVLPARRPVTAVRPMPAAPAMPAKPNPAQSANPKPAAGGAVSPPPVPKAMIPAPGAAGS